MRAVGTFLRVVTVFISIFVFLAHMGIVWLVVRDRWRRIRLSNRILGAYSHWGLWLFRVKVRAVDSDRLKSVGNALFVGNHLSYLDVLVISSRRPACFVTSKEIKETPFLGQICQMAGCLFVERRNKFNIHKEVAEISEGLAHGLDVAIFPEATSTNGEQILRFKRPLYISAIDAGRPVVPFCLNYHHVGGKPITQVTRDHVMWYGDMPFVPHLWALTGSGGVEVDLHFLPPIPTSGADPGALAEQSQKAVASVFRPVNSEAPRPDSPSGGP
jgi:1-acyl-sn-glycerol-3-phosphate acyltransferase